MSLKRSIYFLSLSCLLLGLLVWANHEKKDHVHAPLEARAKVFGPFNGLICSYKWIRIQQYQMTYQYEKVAEETSRVCDLQPYVIESWDYLAWNLAFNLYVEAGENDDRKWRWLRAGLEYLEEGLRYNPGEDRLEMAMAVTMFLKSTASPVMKAKLSEKYGKSVFEVCVDLIHQTSVFEDGELSQVEMSLAMLREAAETDQGIEACRQQIKRFPSLSAKFTEYQEIFKRERL